MKKLLGIMLALSMLLSLTTLQGAAAQSVGVVEVTWAMQAAANEIGGWQSVVDAANAKLAEKNIKIVVQKINTSNWDEYYQKVTAQIAGGNCPDIGRIAESLMPTVIEKNQVMNITDNFNADIDRSAYFESLFNNAGSVDGQMYGLPSGIYHKLMYYNKDLFDKAGVTYPSGDWDHPITMDELVNTAKALSAGEGIDRVYGYYGEADIFMVGCFAGDNIYSADNTYKITDAHKSIYKALDQMLNVDKSMPTPVETKIMGGFDMFRAGKVAMVVDGTWWHQTARDITDFNVGIAAAPSLNGTSNAVSFIDNYVVWSGTKHPAEAWQALKAIFSEDSFNALAQTGTGGVPVSRATLEKYESTLIGDRFSDADKASFIQSLGHTWPMPYNASFNEVSQQTASVLEPWMVGSISVDDMLTQLDQTLAELTK